MKLYSQQLSFRIETGQGSYKMEELKILNDVVKSSLPFETGITEEFPNYWYFKPAIVYMLNKNLSAGIVWSYESTGSRISSKDYSGEYRFDNMIKASSPGVLFELRHSIRKFEFTAFSEAGLVFTRLRMKESIVLNSAKQEQISTFNSVNYYFEPGVRISYPVSIIKISICAGYPFDILKGDFSYEGINNSLLNISENQEARADWTGIRVGISVSYVLFKKD